VCSAGKDCYIYCCSAGKSNRCKPLFVFCPYAIATPDRYKYYTVLSSCSFTFVCVNFYLSAHVLLPSGSITFFSLPTASAYVILLNDREL